MYLSVCPFLSLPLPLYRFLTESLSLSLSSLLPFLMSISFSVCLCVCLSLCVSVFLHLCLSFQPLSMSLSASVCLSVFLCLCLHACLSVSICPSICMFTCLCLCVCVSPPPPVSFAREKPLALCLEGEVLPASEASLSQANPTQSRGVHKHNFRGFMPLSLRRLSEGKISRSLFICIIHCLKEERANVFFCRIS